MWRHWSRHCQEPRRPAFFSGERLRPRRAILTNLHIDLDYETLKAELPAGVEPAYDGLRFEHELRGEFA